MKFSALPKHLPLKLRLFIWLGMVILKFTGVKFNCKYPAQSITQDDLHSIEFLFVDLSYEKFKDSKTPSEGVSEPETSSPDPSDILHEGEQSDLKQ